MTSRTLPVKRGRDRGDKRTVEAPRRVLGRARPDAAFPVPPTVADLPHDYAKVLADLKRRIVRERLRVVLSANAGMVLLYWDIGRTILTRQGREGWGARVIDRLAAARTAQEQCRAGGRDGRRWREFLKLAEADIVLRQAGI
jgi:hypothetical protein